MRTSRGLIFAIVVLAIVVISTVVLSTKRVKPYNAYSKYSDNRVEGMTGKDQGQNTVRYAAYPSGDNVNAKDQFLIQSSAASNTAQRVAGMPGALYGPESADNRIPTFAEAKGSLSEGCETTSSGMSNSMGYLCLDRTQLNLLTTRGGNQTCSTCYKPTGSCECKK